MWLKQLEVEVRPRRVHTDSSARVLLGRYNVEVLAVRPPKQTQCNIGVDAFDWCPIPGYRFVLIPAPLVFTYYCSLAYDSHFRPLLRAMVLKRFGASSFPRVVHTAYRGEEGNFGKQASLRCSKLAWLPIYPTLFDVI